MMKVGGYRAIPAIGLSLLLFSSAMLLAQKPDRPLAAPPPVVDFAGYQAALAKNKGKPVLVNFWATWCEPCRAEYPLLVELAKKHAPRGMVFLGVSFDDDAEINIVKRFLGRYEPPFVNYRLKMGLQVEFAKSVDPAWRGTIPATYIYDAQGQPLVRMIGTQKREQFEAAIELALKSGTMKPAK